MTEETKPEVKPVATLHKDTQVYKEKEITKDKCKVVYHHSYGNYGADGGYGEVYMEVTDETSQKAYETVQKLMFDCTPEGEPEGKVKVNKRASSAVDVR